MEERREEIRSARFYFIAEVQDSRFEPKVGQNGPKWEKSGNFEVYYSVHVGSAPRFVSF